MKSKSSTLKYLVVGDSGVGKTSLLVRYCDEAFQTEYLTTIGVDFKIKRIQYEGQPITLNIWDTAGQERFRNITKSFYKGAHGIVLTYSITDPESYLHIEKWMEQIQETGNADIVMVLVGSKSDLKEQRKVSYKQGEELAQRFDLQFIETSSKQDSNIDEVFLKLTKAVIGKGALDNTKQGNSLPLQEKKKKKKNDSQCC